MGSIMPTLLAQKVSSQIKRGKKVVPTQLAREVGYAPSSAARITQITDTKSYKIAFALETKEIVDKIDRDIARTQEAMNAKNLRKEEYKTLVQSLDTLIKNKQLLSGGSTANVAIKVAISEHIAGKYDKTSQAEGVAHEGNGSTEP